MKRISRNAFVIIYAGIGLVLATLLGIYAQDITYAINERFPVLGLIPAISTITFLSIGLYIIIPLSLVIFKKIKKEYVLIFALIGIPISIWSFFVWAMWMG